MEKHLKAVQRKVQDATGQKTLPKLRAYVKELENSSVFVHGSGHRKSEAQRQWEKLDELRQRWEKYEKSLEIMDPSRNSYSKTDPDATFMRMKADHMRNGQLKSAYNVQIAVNSEYITGIEAFSDHTDFGTLVSFLEQIKQQHDAKYAGVTADAGYESLENYLFYAVKGKTSLLIKRCFCRAHCAGVSAWIYTCGQRGGVDRKPAASCPVQSAQAKKYAGKTSGLLSVPDDLSLPYLFFAEETPRFWYALFRKLCIRKAGS